MIRGHGGANSIFKKADEEAGLRINLWCSSSLRSLVFHSAAEESEYSSRVRVLLQMQTAARPPTLEEPDWGGVGGCFFLSNTTRQVLISQRNGEQMMARLHKRAQRLVRASLNKTFKSGIVFFIILHELPFYLFLEPFCGCVEVYGGSAAPGCRARTSKRCCNPENKYINQ